MRIASTRALAICFRWFLSVLLGIFFSSRGANSWTSDFLSRSQLVNELQTSCFTPQDILDRVGRHVTPAIDPSGELSRLVLVRLSKQWTSLGNRRIQDDELKAWRVADEEQSLLDAVVRSLLESASESSCSYGNLVEGTKAYSIVSRLQPVVSSEEVINFWQDKASNLVPHLNDNEISGIHWAIEGMACSLNSTTNGGKVFVPEPIQRAFADLDLPFRIIPGLLSDSPYLSVQTMCNEVEFNVDQIQTVSNKVVSERRETAWQGDHGVAPFLYGGKAMPTHNWSPIVRNVRDYLADPKSGHNEYYDCSLINHYPNGDSGMRYHVDPDQGTLWDYDTAVVSVGASRRFSFRRIPSLESDGKNNCHHSYVVMHGDVAHMFGRCQEQYQHCVKKAETREDNAARVSLVFKRSLGCKTSS